MNINVFEVNKLFDTSYQFAAEQGGKLAHHFVRILKQGLEYVQHDTKSAVGTVAVMNILFFHIACKVAHLVDRFFEYLCPEEEMSQWGSEGRAFVGLTNIVLLIAGMNVALSKSLQLPLSAWAMTGISVASCTSYILFRRSLMTNNDS